MPTVSNYVSNTVNTSYSRRCSPLPIVAPCATRVGCALRLQDQSDCNDGPPYCRSVICTAAYSPWNAPPPHWLMINHIYATKRNSGPWHSPIRGTTSTETFWIISVKMPFPPHTKLGRRIRPPKYAPCSRPPFWLPCKSISGFTNVQNR